MKKPNSFQVRLSPIFAAALLMHFAASSAFAVPYYWDNDGATPGFGTATGTWAVPTTGNASQGWSEDATGGTLPANVTTTTSDTLNFGASASAVLASGTITVSGTVEANKLVFGVALSGPTTLTGGTIAMGGTSPSITNNRGGQIIESALTLNANTSIATATSSTAITLNGAIGGSADLTFTTTNVNLGGANTFFFLGAASDYSGNTTITLPNTTAAHNNALTVRASVDNALPTTTVLTLDGYAGPGSSSRQVAYDLNGNNQTLAGLTNVVRTNRTQRILNNGGTSKTLTINNTSPASPAFSGNINGTGISLVKTGTGTQILSSTNSYNGNTDISGGKLQGVVGGNCAASKVIISNTLGTFGIAVTDITKTWTCKELAPTAAGTIEFNFGAVTPSVSLSPLTITDPAFVTGVADFTAATPQILVNVDSGLLPGTYPLMTWDSVTGTIPTTADLDVSDVAAGTAASLEVVDNTLYLVIASTAVSIVKNDNALALNNGNSWVGGMVPATTELAEWNNTVNSANTTDLGANATWAGIVIENPNGLVTINGTNTLTLGAAAIDIDLSTAHTADLTLNCPLALGDANAWNVSATRTVTLAGQVSGAFGIEKLGDGTAILSSGSNSYTGTTEVTAGILKLGASQVIPDGTGKSNISVAGTLDLNGNSETVNGLSGAGIIDNTLAATSPTLTVGANDQTSTFSGVLQNTVGTLNLIKTGTGKLTLGSANTLGGSVTVNGGTLAFSNANPFANVSGITLAGGTTLRPGAGLQNPTISAPITLTGDSTIHAPDFGTGSTTSTLTLGGAITGSAGLTLVSTTDVADNSQQTILLDAQSDYTGNTTFNPLNEGANLIVKLGTENALPTTTVLSLKGVTGGGSGRFTRLNLNGFNQMLAGLQNTPLSLRSQQIYNSSGTDATLTVNNAADFTCSARIGGGTTGNNLGLTKSGVGTFTISGANTYTGATIVTGGTLTLGATNVLPDTSPVAIAAGTLSAATAGTEVAGTLEVTGAATINLGANANLAFATGSPAWSGALTITGAFVSGVSLKFGDDINGLTPAQIAAISGPGLSNIGIDSSGFITATVASGGYAAWAATNAGGQGSELDFDNDGVTNGVEFFLNAAPGFTANPALNGLNSITWTNGGNIPASAYGSQFVVQTSGNLAAWTDVPVGQLTTNSDGPGGSLTYTLSGTAPRFVRLMVLPD